MADENTMDEAEEAGEGASSNPLKYLLVSGVSFLVILALTLIAIPQLKEYGVITKETFSSLAEVEVDTSAVQESLLDVKERELKDREERLSVKERELAALEKELTSREEGIEQSTIRLDSFEAKRIKQIAKVFASMDPQSVVPIIEAMDKKTVTNILKAL